MQKNGKFIVLDGTDGSGKTTQFRMLKDRLEKNGKKVKIADFPQYGKKSAGPVEKYLNGKYGTAKSVGPYRGSIFYACDRYDASFKIKKWLEDGRIVISNRYVSSNMGHQGGKISDKNERKKYFEWLYDLEFNIFKIPRPDLNVILHVEAEIAQKLIEEKRKHNRSRRYIENNESKDIHEKDLQHLKDAEKVYLEISKMFSDFTIIECTKNKKILTRKKINEILWNKIQKII